MICRAQKVREVIAEAVFPEPVRRGAARTPPRAGPLVPESALAAAVTGMAWFRFPAYPAVLVSGLMDGRRQFRVVGRQRREVHDASVTGSFLPGGCSGSVRCW